MTPRTAAEEALRRSRPVAFDDHDDRFVIVVEPNGEAPAPGQLRLDTDELLLARDVLDCQIVDLRGRRLTRASVVVLARTPEGGLTFVGVEVGIAAVLRRLGLGWLTGRLRHQVVPVDQLRP